MAATFFSARLRMNLYSRVPAVVIRQINVVPSNSRFNAGLRCDCPWPPHIKPGRTFLDWLPSYE